MSNVKKRGSIDGGSLISIKIIYLIKIYLLIIIIIVFCLGGKTPDPQSKARSYAEIMGEVAVRNAKVIST